ncbi:MAG: S-layer homology domain-containing protein [Ruminococcaceae bacterium]|nr:S-layer homology domain-containing protein [Oscillospiraceae bacterium]
MKKFLLLLLCCILIINSSFIAFADDLEDEEKELFVDGTEINAITDYSTYGAADVTEMSSVNYLDKNRFTDIKDGELLKRVSLLSALGIVSGTGEGKFSPEAPFTRIQFVLTALRMIKYDASMYNGDGVEFYDINKDYEYLPEIEAAVKLGIIAGFSDKTLKPDAPISYQDALTVMLRIMGYTTNAHSKGGYPDGFIKVGAELDLDDDIVIKDDGIFTRANAATLLYNCLHADCLWSPIMGNKSSQIGEMGTMLEAYFDIYQSYGIIESTYLANIGDNEKATDNTVIIGGVKYFCEKHSYADYIGKCVDVYYEEKNNIKTIKHLEIYNDEKEIIIKSDDIADFDDYTYQYYDGSKLKTAKIDVGHTLIYNNKRKISYNKDIFMPKNGYVRLLRTCDFTGTGYNVVFVNEYFNFYVDSLSANGSILKFTPNGETSGMVIDMANEDLLMEIYDKNGRMSSDLSVTDTYDNDGNLVKKYLVPPIPAKSVISVFADEMDDAIGNHKILSKNATYLKVYINDAKIEGTIDEQDFASNKLVIGDKEFEFSTDNFLFEDNAIKIGTEGTFLFDFNGKIAAYIEKGKDEFIYGYLVNAIDGRDFNADYKFKILKPNGQIEMFNCVDIKALKLNGKKLKDTTELGEKLNKSAKLIDKTFTISQIIKYKLNEENKIKELQTVTASTGIATGYEADHLNRHAPRASYTSPQYFGGALFSADGDIVVEGRKLARYSKSGFYFIVPDAETFEDKDYGVKADTYYFSSSTKMDLYNCNENLSADVAVIYAKTELTQNDPPFIVVKNKKQVVDEDGMGVVAVSGVDGYREAEFVEKTEGVFSNAKEGDVYFCKGSFNQIEEAEMIYSLYDVANHNYDSTEYIMKTLTADSETLYATPMEVYDYSAATRSFVLQMGPDGDGDGKRDMQRVCYWSNISTTFRYGCVTCNIYDREIELKTGNAGDIRPARKFSHKDSTKILIVESSNLRFFVLVNDYRN